jgi:hypothetical protein
MELVTNFRWISKMFPVMEKWENGKIVVRNSNSI